MNRNTPFFLKFDSIYRQNSKQKVIMDAIKRYISFSVNTYYGEVGCIDNEAKVIEPFLEYKEGDIVNVSVEYSSGIVTINDKKIIFGIIA